MIDRALSQPNGRRFFRGRPRGSLLCTPIREVEFGPMKAVLSSTGDRASRSVPCPNG